jgi:phage head maturation protease
VIDYERAARIRDFQDRQRGYSIMGAAPLTHVGGEAIRRPWFQCSTSSKVLEGFACLYDVPHQYKGRTEIFAKQCFSGSIDGVMFFIEHKLLTKKLGDQDDGNLELLDTDIGLAFRLKLAPGDLERLDGRDEVSVSYLERNVELRNGVRIIKSATLFEVSACFVGAMRQTHAAVRDASSVGALHDDVKSSFASEAAATKFIRALKNLESR